MIKLFNPFSELVKVAEAKIDYPVVINFTPFNEDGELKENIKEAEIQGNEIPKDSKGITMFPDGVITQDHEIFIFIDVMQTMPQMLDVLAHELAHVITVLDYSKKNEMNAKGFSFEDSDHSEQFGKNFKWIFDEYGKVVEKENDNVVMAETGKDTFEGYDDENLKDETAEQAVRRELEEETGLKVKEIMSIGKPTYSSSGITDEAIQIAFVKCERDIGEQKLGASENITLELVDRNFAQMLVESKDMSVGAKAWTVLYMILNISHKEFNLYYQDEEE